MKLTEIQLRWSPRMEDRLQQLRSLLKEIPSEEEIGVDVLGELGEDKPLRRDQRRRRGAGEIGQSKKRGCQFSKIADRRGGM